MTTDLEDRKIRKVFICGSVEKGIAICGHTWYSD
jgi:hypothetical protein